MTSEICMNIADVHERMRHAELAAGKTPNSVRLIAVTKGQSIETIRAAYDLGLREFGENYLSEAIEKRNGLRDLKDIVWHFIGPIQSNKARQIAENFDWVHSVDRAKVACRLDQYRPDHLPPLQVCIQVNISGEQTKSGVNPSELSNLVDAVGDLKGLILRGLMTIPAPHQEEGLEQGMPFRILREMMEHLEPQLDTLSMGMSHDFESAILEGATMVRIGTLLFGARHR